MTPLRSLLLAAVASVGSIVNAAPALSVAVQQSATFEIMGATAAWAVDASLVDVAAHGGAVTLFGRAPGKTKIVVVTIAGQSTLDVEVAGGRAAAAERPETATGRARAAAAVQYTSATREVQTNVEVTSGTASARRTEVSARIVHHSAPPPGDSARTSIASAAYRIFTSGREITLFDREVDHSPLTVTRTPLRGIHYLDSRWRVHAGYTVNTVYQALLVPVERQLVAGAGYTLPLGKRGTLTPSLFTIGNDGTIVSMLYAWQRDTALRISGEIGYSNSLGAGAQLAYDGDRDRVRADVRYRPDAFATPKGSPRGSFADLSWDRTLSRGSSLSVEVSATDAARARMLATVAGAEYRLTDAVWLNGGASWAMFGDASSTAVPFGARLELSRGAVGATYRYATSSTNRAGHGVRLFARTHFGRVHLSLSGERQRNTPTLDVIFSERPDLALALEELGISASSPADIARALRGQAALQELGFIEGVTVDLAPMRTQAAFEMAWLGSSASRPQLRARVLHNVVESVSDRNETTIASIAYAQRLTSTTDVYLSYSWWRVARRAQEAHIQPLFQIGLRTNLDSLAAFNTGTGAIEGIVFLDEDLDGRSDGSGIDAVLELDGSRTTKTRSDGTFEFRGVPRGTHVVVARIPDRTETFFTTPSRAEVETGDRIAFGVATTPARLSGRVTSDSGEGIAGVRLLLTRGREQVTASTDSAGAYSFAVAPGEWTLTAVPDSVPPGYALAALGPRTVMLERSAPRQSDLTLRAHRALAGRDARPGEEIRVASLDRSVHADASGAFALRNLPAGRLVVTANGTEREVEIPRAPSVTEISFAAGPKESTAAHFTVAIGAYRVHANAVDAMSRANRAGVEATLAGRGELTLVTAGPFRSRVTATQAAMRLAQAGLDAVILSRN